MALDSGPRAPFIDGIEGRVLAPHLASELHPDGFGLQVEWPEEDHRLLDQQGFFWAATGKVLQFGMVHLRLSPKMTHKLAARAVRGEWKFKPVFRGEFQVNVPHTDHHVATVTALFASCEMNERRSTGFAPLIEAHKALKASRGALRREGGLPDRLLSRLAKVDRVDVSDPYALQKVHTEVRHWIHKNRDADVGEKRYVDATLSHLREGMVEGVGVGDHAIEHLWKKGDLVLTHAQSMHWRGHGAWCNVDIDYFDWKPNA